MAIQFKLVKRRPFSRLAKPCVKTYKTLYDLTARGVNYKPGPNNRGYEYFRGELLGPVARELLRRSRQGAPVHFLDAGAGDGHGLVAAESLSSNIRGHGLAMHDSNPVLGVPAHKWTTGRFEENVFQDSDATEGVFDVIQSRYGLQHAANQAMALENLLNSLKVGGKLFNFHDSDRNTIQLADTGMAEALEKQGFVLEKGRAPQLLKKIYDRIFVNSPKLYVITRTSDRKADLSAFYGSARINKVPLKK